MERHAFFDLVLHTTQELEILLGDSIVERATLHEWPLSCVQRIVLEQGKTWIYKAESSPTVEPEFYTHASSPLLVEARVLYRETRHACLLLEYLDAPLAEDLRLEEEEAAEAGRRLLSDIAAVQGKPPVYLDVSTWNSWKAVMDGMVEDLHGLVGSGKYHQTSRDAIRTIAHAASSKAVSDVFSPESQYPPGLVHHDLSADNVFILEEGFRVIDWQRPILGPPEIDIVLFLASLGFDPRRHVNPGIIAITDLLRIHWLVECTRCWFPEGSRTYDRSIAHIARQLSS